MFSPHKAAMLLLPLPPALTPPRQVGNVHGALSETPDLVVLTTERPDMPVSLSESADIAVVLTEQADVVVSTTESVDLVAIVTETTDVVVSTTEGQ